MAQALASRKSTILAVMQAEGGHASAFQPLRSRLLAAIGLGAAQYLRDGWTYETGWPRAPTIT